jgi:hypothetical protein
MENIITIEEFDPTNIVLNNPTKNTHGGTVIPVHYQCPRRGKIPFIIKPPKCELPYGVSQFPTADKVVKGEENKVNYSLNISFNGFDNNFEKNPEIGMFFNKWKKMETHIHKQLLKNCQKFLGSKVKSMDVMESMCWPIVKHSKDKEGEVTNKYPPTFSIKLPRYSKNKDGSEPEFSTKFIHKGTESKLTVGSTNKESNDHNVYDAFPRYSEARTLIQCTSLQSVAKLSMSFKAIQVQSYPGKNQISGNAFADDSDDESEHETPSVVETSNASNASDEEESGDESDEAEVESDSD